MMVERSSPFRRSGAWRVSLVLALVAILALLPSLLSTASAARAFAGPGAHVGETVALAGCGVASLDQPPLQRDGDHSDACRFCLGSPCAGQALVPSGGAPVSFAFVSHRRAIGPAAFAPVAVDATSGWGSSWTAQAPPAFG